jgi:CMP/dCMP kinase
MHWKKEKRQLNVIFKMKSLLITIDGPAGAGKTTVSRRLARKLGYRYLDTGALYRAVALKAAENEVSSDHDLEMLCQNLTLNFVHEDGVFRLFCNGEDVTDRIRTNEISMMASKISAKPVVRKTLLSVQREMGKKKEVIAEGRDMGTVVFPDADIKFFLDATPKTRALRRYQEIGLKSAQTLKQVEDQIKKRDKNDSSRELAPLKAAPDAIIIDSTKFSIEQVVEQMFKYISDVFVNKH